MSSMGLDPAIRTAMLARKKKPAKPKSATVTTPRTSSDFANTIFDSHKPGSVGQSPAQQIVSAILKPYLDQIKQQQADLASRQAQQQEALKGYSQAIIDYLKGQPGAIGSSYDEAIRTTRDLASASADRLLASNPNSLDQSMLAAINAPQEQRDALAQQNQNVFGGGSATLNYTGGTIPASVFAEDKAAASAFANSLPAIQGLAGTQAFQQLLATQGQDSAKLDQALAEVLAKQPQMVYEVMKDLAAAQAKSAPSTKAPTVKQIGDYWYEWNASKGWVRIAKAKSSDKVGQVRLANGQYVTTMNGTPVGEPWGPVKTATGSGGSSGGRGSGKLYGNSTSGYFTYDNGKLVPVPGYTPKGKNGKPVSPTTFSNTVARATKAGNEALNKVTGNVWKRTPGSNADPKKDPEAFATAKKNAEIQLTKSFGTAMYRVIVAIGPHLKSVGYTPAQVKQAAYQIVSSVITPPSWYKPPKAAPPNPKVASYSGGGGDKLISLLKQAGFSGDGLRIAYGIAMRESGGRPDAFNGNTNTGDRSWGLFQINTLGSLKSRVKKYGLSSEQDLLDPLTNARIAYRMSNGGRDFGAWGIGPNAYRSGMGMNTIRPWTGPV